MSRCFFFALLSRMKYIARWGLMRCTVQENVAEHSHSVAVIAHALAVIKNTYFGGAVDAHRVAVLAMYHDASEIITGDMPTPIKYYNQNIVSAYKDIEHKVGRQLTEMLPEEMQKAYTPLLQPQPEDKELWRLVKAADKLSAYIKCLEEVRMSNPEFQKALESTRESLLAMELPEVQYFMDHFLESYGLSLDELR